MSAGYTPEDPDRRDDPEGPATPVALVGLWGWVRGRLMVVGRGLLLLWGWRSLRQIRRGCQHR